MAPKFELVGSLDAHDGSTIAVFTQGAHVMVGLGEPGGRMAVITLAADARDAFIKLWAEAERRAEANAAQAVSGT